MAQSSLVTSNFSVNFSISAGSGGAGSIKAEVDNRSPAAGGLNPNTNFKPGQDVHWLLFKDSNIVIQDIIASQGTNVAAGTVEYDIDDTVTVGGAFDTNLSYPVGGSFSATWVGSGGIQADVTAPPAGSSNITFSMSGNPTFDKYGAVGVLRVQYTATADHYILQHSPPEGLSEYEIVVFVSGAPSV